MLQGKFLKSQIGASLAEAIVAVGIFGAIALGVGAGIQQMSSVQIESRQLRSSDVIKTNIINVLNHPEAWKKTLNDARNTVFNCVITGKPIDDFSACKGVTGPLLSIVTATGKDFYIADGNHGFMEDGTMCVFDSTNESTCWFTVALSVEYVCGDPCQSPLAKVRGVFSRRGASVATGHFDFELFKDTEESACAAGCRVIELSTADLSPGSGVVDAPELKVVLIVDNSNSMQSAQEYLNKGIKKVLTKLGSLDVKVKFYIYTTTQFRWAETYQSGSSLAGGLYPTTAFNTVYNWVDPNGYERNTTSHPSNYIGYYMGWYYTSYTTYRDYYMLPPVGGTIEIGTSISDEDLNKVIDKMEDILTAGIGTNGSTDEMGLCSMARTITDKGPYSIFAPGDKALFLIVSDENDITTGNRCMSKRVSERYCDGEKYGYTMAYGTCSGSDCDQYQYDVKTEKTYSFAHNNVYATCEMSVTADGYTNVKLTSKNFYNDVKDTTCADLEDLYGKNGCTPQQAVKGETFCVDGHTNYSCKRAECYNNDGGVETLHFTDSKNTDKDLRVSKFSYDGIEYENIYDFMVKRKPGKKILMEGAARYGYKKEAKCQNSPENVTNIQKEYGYASETSVIDLIKGEGAKTFGPKGFTVSAIINDEKLNQAAGCTQMVTSDKYGKQYSDLAASLESVGSVASICSEDYTGALDQVEDFVKNRLKDTITLPNLDPGEVIVKIEYQDASAGWTIMKMSTALNIVADSDVTVIGNSIQFEKEEFLKNPRPVRITIGKDLPKLVTQYPVSAH